MVKKKKKKKTSVLSSPKTKLQNESINCKLKIHFHRSRLAILLSTVSVGGLVLKVLFLVQYDWLTRTPLGSKTWRRIGSLWMWVEGAVVHSSPRSAAGLHVCPPCAPGLMCFHETAAWHSSPGRELITMNKGTAVIVSLRGPRITTETSLAMPLKECLQLRWLTVNSTPWTGPRLTEKGTVGWGLTSWFLTVNEVCTATSCLPCQDGPYHLKL